MGGRARPNKNHAKNPGIAPEDLGVVPECHGHSGVRYTVKRGRVPDRLSKFFGRPTPEEGSGSLKETAYSAGVFRGVNRDAFQAGEAHGDAFTHVQDTELF
jgi:hypothetical protein